MLLFSPTKQWSSIVWLSYSTLKKKTKPLFILGKHRDFQNIGFCPIPQHIELSAKHRSRSKVWLPAKLSVKDLTLVPHRRLLCVRVAWHRLLCVLRRYWNFALHTTPQVFEYSKQWTRWLLTLSNSLSLLYSLFIEFKLLSGWNYFF